MYDYNAVQKVLQCIIYSNSQMEFSIKDYLVYKSGKNRKHTATVLANWDFTPVHKYYINRVTYQSHEEDH